jgi:hypothetical protein
LEQLAAELKAKYVVNVTCISCDLADAEAPLQLQKAVGDREIDILVYNAALSYIGPFEKNSIEQHNQMAQANMITPMSLLQIFGEPMLKRGKGALVLMEVDFWPVMLPPKPLTGYWAKAFGTNGKTGE